MEAATKAAGARWSALAAMAVGRLEVGQVGSVPTEPDEEQAHEADQKHSGDDPVRDLQERTLVPAL